MHLDANNLYGWGMSQKLPVKCFKRIKKLSKFDERLIKDYDENSNRGYFLEVDVENIQKIYLIFIVIYHFYLKKVNSKNVISLLVTYITKKTMFST